MKTIIAILALTTLCHAGSFESWLACHGLLGNDAEPSADPDHDQICNLTEFTLAGCDPLVMDGWNKLPRFNMTSRWLDYEPRQNISGVRLTVEGSVDLMGFTTFIWIPPEPYGFRRLKIEHSAVFGAWSDTVDALPAGDKAMFSTMDHANSTYARNSACWGAGVNLTAISAWNSTGQGQHGGVLVSPRHVLFSTHWRPEVGAAIRFVSQGNEVIERTISAIADIGQSSDISVATINSDVPSAISFAKVMPSTWRTSLPTFDGYRVPILGTDQEKKLLCFDVTSIGEGGTKNLTVMQPAMISRATHYEPIVSGDSGGPVCFLINGELVLACMWSFASGGTFIPEFLTEINTAMATLGGEHQLAAIPLP